jgi:hypothetical protein
MELFALQLLAIFVALPDSFTVLLPLENYFEEFLFVGFCCCLDEDFEWKTNRLTIGSGVT